MSDYTWICIGFCIGAVITGILIFGWSLCAISAQADDRDGTR